MPGFKDFTSAVLSSADVDSYLMAQAVIQCTSSTRPSSPHEGMVIAETNTGRYAVYTGSAWQYTGWFKAAGRIGCFLGNPAGLNFAYAIPTSTLETIGWVYPDPTRSPFYDPAAMHDHTGNIHRITAPAGCGGMYGFEVYIPFTAGWTDATSQIRLTTSTGYTSYRPVLPPAFSASFGPIELAAGDFAFFQVFHASGATRTIDWANGWVRARFLSPL